MRKLLLLAMGVLLIFVQALAQTKEVTGKVTDSRDGSPLSSNYPENGRTQIGCYVQ